MGWNFAGPHAVGYIDLSYLDAEVSGITVDSVPFEKHLVGRIFYPTHKPEKTQSRTWLGRRGDPWLPGANYSQGMGKFLFFRTTGALYTLAQYAVSAMAYVMGRAQTLDLHPGAPLATIAPGDGSFKHPVVVFSHGLGGHRGMYSIVAGELASQGYIVLALEHADGTASCCHLAGPDRNLWRFYKGLGGDEGIVQKVRDRVVEMKTAARVLHALDAGKPPMGLELTHGFDPASFLAEKLDFGCLVAMGHSYGGVTVTALVCEDPSWVAAVAMDPWWPAMPPESPALECFRTKVPLMLQPSHDWSVPNAWGKLTCDGERQASVMAAARKGGGAPVRLVLAGSSHNTFADALPLFGNQVGWLLEKLGLSARLDPVLGVYLSITASLAFLATHLPLSAAQQAVQDWHPGGKGDGLLQRVAQRDAADKGESKNGFFRGPMPGKGLLDTVSDWLLDRALGSGSSNKKKGAQAGRCGENGTQLPPEEPDDIGSGAEVAETLLPSSFPASGAHPHAPSRRSGDMGSALEVQAAASKAAGQADALQELLGAQHIFALEA